MTAAEAAQIKEQIRVMVYQIVKTGECPKIGLAK